MSNDTCWWLSIWFVMASPFLHEVVQRAVACMPERQG